MKPFDIHGKTSAEIMAEAEIRWEERAGIRGAATASAVPPKVVAPTSPAPAEKKKSASRERTDYLTQVYALCYEKGLENPAPEYRFHPTRKWRFDFAWAPEKVALEIEGGVWTRGRHTRGGGAIGDMEKYNEAVILGWAVIRCVPGDIWGGVEAASRCLANRRLANAP